MFLLELVVFFFFNDTATTEIYTLSLHDALPIYVGQELRLILRAKRQLLGFLFKSGPRQFHLAVLQFDGLVRSEEHTSELQSRQYLVCRLLLEKKKQDEPFAVFIQRPSGSAFERP